MNKVQTGLIVNIAEEQEAITEYGKLAKVARKNKLPKVAALFTHIQKQEKHHKSELSKALKKLEAKKK